MADWDTILVVDDEKNTREGLGKFLEAQGYDTSLAASAKEALELIKKENPSVIVSDIRMPEMDGITLLHKVKECDPHARVILLTAYGSVENAVQAMKAGAFHYLTKPVNLDELEFAIKKALTSQNLERENIELKKELVKERYETGTMISRSSKMKKVIELAKQVAKSDSTVLLEGETGTGKELIAHLIHNVSARKDRSFIAVHCAALTETLLASELFGHERGAFTGATERKVGRFERAHMGTLFLDEIAEIPESMQVKLLRVLQEGEFERVGGTKTLKVDVRLITATNKILSEQVKKGKFREDLFYRVNVILLEIPPLRQRPEDIRPLAEHYLEFFGRANNKIIKGFSEEAMKALENYSWPGNIRELRNIVERMVVLALGNTLEVDHVPNDIRFPETQATAGGIEIPSGNLRDVEKETIRKKLIELRGNKSKTAKQLGISRRTLYRKMEEYHL